MSNTTNALQKLNAAGQSVWYDNISRSMLSSGELSRMVSEDDLRGVTSNPAIFDKAMTQTSDYDASFKRILSNNPEFNSRDLFFALAIEDIRDAADILLPVHQATQGEDGMVSLEISPDLAYDTQATIDEARRLYERVGRQNVMIKIPATEQSLPAIEALTAEGINLNVTLLFSVERYKQVAEAYIRGLRTRYEQGLAIDKIASVASFFVSRVDAAVDKLLEADAVSEKEDAAKLLGKIAIANAKCAYRAYLDIFQQADFDALSAVGARKQRLLWASTGTKNPAYPTTMYVDTLIGENTVNTMPPETYDNFRNNGKVSQSLVGGIEEAESQLKALLELGVDIEKVADELEKQGVEVFIQAFDNLLEHIDAKRIKYMGSTV